MSLPSLNSKEFGGRNLLTGRSVSQVEIISGYRRWSGCRITHRQMTLMLFEDMIKDEIRSGKKNGWANEPM
jgi:hypothetical protein